MNLKLKVTNMSKRRSTDKSATSGKKQTKFITLEEKLDGTKHYMQEIQGIHPHDSNKSSICQPSLDISPI
jgi:hypothetical protein